MIKFVLMSLISMAWIGTANPASIEDNYRIVPIPKELSAQLSTLIVPAIKEMAERLQCDKKIGHVSITAQMTLFIEVGCLGQEVQQDHAKMYVMSAEYRAR